MRETWFGPLIKDVEQKIINQQGEKWDRELFEKHLMGYTMRTDRYRLVAWRDHRDPNAEPLFVELFDHKTDPTRSNQYRQEQSESCRKVVGPDEWRLEASVGIQCSACRNRVVRHITINSI